MFTDVGRYRGSLLESTEQLLSVAVTVVHAGASCGSHGLDVHLAQYGVVKSESLDECALEVGRCGADRQLLYAEKGQR